MLFPQWGYSDISEIGATLTFASIIFKVFFIPEILHYFYGFQMRGKIVRKPCFANNTLNEIESQNQNIKYPNFYGVLLLLQRFKIMIHDLSVC